jgi:hypothetical protein
MSASADPEAPFSLEEKAGDQGEEMATFMLRGGRRHVR